MTVRYVPQACVETMCAVKVCRGAVVTVDRELTFDVVQGAMMQDDGWGVSGRCSQLLSRQQQLSPHPYTIYSPL